MTSPPLGSDPGIWVTQPKQWRRVITRSVGDTALSTQRSRSVSVFNTDVNVGAASAEGTISATVAPFVKDMFVDYFGNCFAYAQARCSGSVVCLPRW